MVGDEREKTQRSHDEACVARLKKLNRQLWRSHILSLCSHAACVMVVYVKRLYA